MTNLSVEKSSITNLDLDLASWKNCTPPPKKTPTYSDRPQVPLPFPMAAEKTMAAPTPENNQVLSPTDLQLYNVQTLKNKLVLI